MVCVKCGFNFTRGVFFEEFYCENCNPFGSLPLCQRVRRSCMDEEYESDVNL